MTVVVPAQARFASPSSVQMSAVMLLALASVGGVGYASSAAEDAAVSVKRVVTPKDVIQIVKRGSAIDQYRKPKAKKVKKAKKAKKGKATKGRVRARTRPPFTG